ncbi:MAG: hypothetical protein ACYTDV_17845, partial [Planctomycetota bacterium]
MRRCTTILCSILLLGAFSCASVKEQMADSTEPSVEIDSEMREVLEKINAVSAYEVPDLDLREDADYAKTAHQFEPFRHVEPYKEHFLIQMEYTGPGRAIP